MITVNPSDTNLPEILTESKLSNLVTKEKYYVYGLKREGNPLVHIEYEACYVNNEFQQRLKALIEFFNTNEITVETDNGSSSPGIQIGMRIDMRQVMNKNNKPLFAASVLATIVYCLEDRLDIDNMKKYKLSSMPKFES